MMKRVPATALFAALILWHWPAAAGDGELRLYDLASRKTLVGQQALARLQAARFVLVGEHHNNAEHHLAQLQVIRALYQSGRKVAVGMEMFRNDSQPELDRWVAGTMEIDRFRRVFMDNWNYDWDLYRPIFDYVRRNQIPLIGLNVPGEVTTQVAYHGFESLNKEQKGALEGITCDVTAEYRDFIREAYGAHAHGKMNFGRFCEAQLVWDTAMAMNGLNYIDRHPGAVMVILTGSGHARKLGIPSQLRKRTAWPYAVLMPETQGTIEPDTLTTRDADFIVLAR